MISNIKMKFQNFKNIKNEFSWERLKALKARAKYNNKSSNAD